MRTISVHTEYITLGQLLKLADLVQSGGEVRLFLAERPLRVNGEPEDRRGRKLRPGDVIEVEGEEPITLTGDGETAAGA
jgi:S4 domain protein YaaA